MTDTQEFQECLYKLDSTIRTLFLPFVQESFHLISLADKYIYVTVQMTIWYNWQLYRYKSQFSSVPGQITIGKCPGTIANRTGTNHNCYMYQDRSQLTTVLVQLSIVSVQITIVICTRTDHN